MKKLALTPEVEIALRTLDPEGVRRVQAWFACLQRWDTDAAVRENSDPLEEFPGVFVLRTTTDLRIFFRLEGETITILDIARRAAILASGGG